MKKKSSIPSKLAKHEVSLVHNNPLFNTTTVHMNPLFEPPKPVSIPSHYGASTEAEAEVNYNQCAYDEEQQHNYLYPQHHHEQHNQHDHHHHHEHHHHHHHHHQHQQQHQHMNPMGQEDEGMTWYSAMGNKVEVKLEDAAIDPTDPQFSKQQLWSQPHNEVLKRELRRNNRDDKQNYSYPDGKSLSVRYPPETRTSIYINKPRLSLPVQSTHEVKTETEGGPGVRASFPLDPNRRRGRDPSSKAGRSSKAPAFKCLMPGCDKLFPDAFALSEHCVQHAFDFKEFIKQNDEEYMKRAL